MVTFGPLGNLISVEVSILLLEFYRRFFGRGGVEGRRERNWLATKTYQLCFRERRNDEVSRDKTSHRWQQGLGVGGGSQTGLCRDPVKCNEMGLSKCRIQYKQASDVGWSALRSCSLSLSSCLTAPFSSPQFPEATPVLWMSLPALLHHVTHPSCCEPAELVGRWAVCGVCSLLHGFKWSLTSKCHRNSLHIMNFY